MSNVAIGRRMLLSKVSPRCPDFQLMDLMVSLTTVQSQGEALFAAGFPLTVDVMRQIYRRTRSLS